MTSEEPATDELRAQLRRTRRWLWIVSLLSLLAVAVAGGYALSPLF